MESGIKRTSRNYTLSFKLAVVEQVERGELTYGQAQTRYGIQGHTTVLKWLRQHGRQDWWSMASYGSMDKRTKMPPLTPDQRIKELEVQLKDAQEKAQLFEAVLDVLKKDYGVRVIKKPSGKSSRRNVLKD
jgi:transposase-like protein